MQRPLALSAPDRRRASQGSFSFELSRGADGAESFYECTVLYHSTLLGPPGASNLPGGEPGVIFCQPPETLTTSTAKQPILGKSAAAGRRNHAFRLVRIQHDLVRRHTNVGFRLLHGPRTLQSLEAGAPANSPATKLGELTGRQHRPTHSIWDGRCGTNLLLARCATRPLAL